MRKYRQSTAFTAFSALEILGSFENHFYAHLPTSYTRDICRITVKIVQCFQQKIHGFETPYNSQLSRPIRSSNNAQM